MTTHAKENAATNGLIRTLIVDDSRTFREALAEFLATVPRVEVIGVATDGQEAVNAVARLRPDLVLTDLHMPGMDGLEATALIRARHPATRVIVLSLLETPSLALFSLEHGADAFVSKCKAPEELPRMLARLFPDPVRRVPEEQP